jgi:type IV pilus assembly protein PilV
MRPAERQRSRQRRPASRRERGFTLIESMIAILIFAVGILGLVGMQTASTRVTSDARMRTEAAAAADELIARMLASSRATVATDFQTGGTQFNTWRTNRLQAAGTGLPGADATVTFGAVGGDANTVRVVITWTPPRESERDLTGVKTAVSVVRQHVTVSALYD